MCVKFLFLIILILAISVQTFASEQNGKIELGNVKPDMIQVMTALASLHELAIDNKSSSNAERRKKVLVLINSLESIDSIILLAQLTHTIRKQSLNADSQAYGEIFDFAFSDCLNKFRKKLDKATLAKLKALKSFCRPDGGDSLIFHEIYKINDLKYPVIEANKEKSD